MIVNLDIPNDIYDRASEIAQTQHLSVADVLATACSEHGAAWERLELRARRGDRKRFDAVLAKVPDVEAHDIDRFKAPIEERVK